MSNPFMQEDPEETKAYKKMIATCIAAASGIVLLFLIVLYSNNKDKSKASDIPDNSEVVETEEFSVGESNLTSKDLDFWDMYEKEETISDDEEDEELTPYHKTDEDDELKENILKENEKNKEDESESLNKEPDSDFGSSDSKYNDDSHLAVVGKDRKTTYYEIITDVTKHPYDLENKLTKDDKGRFKYDSGDLKSISGVDLSKYNGSVDFQKVKADGIDFAMLRIASRGYGTGVISLDEKFVEYATNAKENGINIGVYFFSQAISKEEAVEEACYAVGAIANYGVRYPIAIDMETVDDESRTDKLTMKERTEIAKAFCDTVKQYGYNPIIYANRDYLVSKLNLEDLDGYDVWLADKNNITDYPYKFSMWQYSQEGSVDGIEGSVDLDLSFVKYEEK